MAAPPSRCWGHRGAGSCCRPSPVPFSLLPRAGPAGAPRGLPGPQASSQLTPAPPAGPGEQGPEVGGVLRTPPSPPGLGPLPSPLTVCLSRWEPLPFLLPLSHQHPGQGLSPGPLSPPLQVGNRPGWRAIRTGLQVSRLFVQRPTQDCVQGQRRTEAAGSGLGLPQGVRGRGGPPGEQAAREPHEGGVSSALCGPHQALSRHPGRWAVGAAGPPGSVGRGCRRPGGLRAGRGQGRALSVQPVPSEK